MNSTIFHDYIISEVLDVSQTVCHRDVTIICSNGIFKSNSFVLEFLEAIAGAVYGQQ